MNMDINFDEVTAVCDVARLPVNAAELHGQMTGLHLSTAPLSFTAWFSTFCQDAEITTALEAEDETLLQQLYQQISAELNRADLAFALLLPDDDFPLEKRIIALAQWVQGFLVGFAGTGVDNKKIKGEIKETLEDLMKIAQIDKMPIDEDEDTEKQYAEIMEYVRMAVLLLHTEFAGEQ